MYNILLPALILSPLLLQGAPGAESGDPEDGRGHRQHRTEERPPVLRRPPGGAGRRTAQHRHVAEGRLPLHENVRFTPYFLVLTFSEVVVIVHYFEAEGLFPPVTIFLDLFPHAGYFFNAFY